MNFINQALDGARRSLATLLIEQPAGRLGIDRLIERLEQSGQRFERKAAASKGRGRNLDILAGMIGNERWSQRRIRVALGERHPSEDDQLYRPGSRDWKQLREAFSAARRDTISLGKTIRMAGLDLHTCVHHNQLGEISLLGWLYYLSLRAGFDSLRMN